MRVSSDTGTGSQRLLSVLPPFSHWLGFQPQDSDVKKEENTLLTTLAGARQSNSLCHAYFAHELTLLLGSYPYIHETCLVSQGEKVHHFPRLSDIQFLCSSMQLF